MAASSANFESRLSQPVTHVVGDLNNAEAVLGRPVYYVVQPEATPTSTSTSVTYSATMAMADSEAYKVPIASRPPQPYSTWLFALASAIVFYIGCSMINATQFIFLLPLRLLPFTWARDIYEQGIRYTKGAAGCLFILMCQLFSPTKFHITFERHGKGSFTQEEIDSILVRDTSGAVVSLNMPHKHILIANHQIYADWWYAWSLTYFMGNHRDVFIVLKNLWKWVPIVGWAMQFFDFIFLAQSWASDRVHLAAHLSAIGRSAEREDKPLTLLLYPEGTLVSHDTRPKSKKYADKMGIPDMTHTLLPRSTGLLYSLRSLAPRVPSLRLVDLTIVYPGVPPMGYGQDYYTLRSIFISGTPPPVIHIHLRMFDVAGEVPIGDITSSNPSVLPESSQSGAQPVEVDFPEQEKAVFDLWLRELWREKDESISRFHDSGRFCPDMTEKSITEIPLKLRRKREVFDAFCFFLPAAVGYIWAKAR